MPYRNIAVGLFIFSIGLFKKVIIADTFAVWATAGFDTATTLNLFEAWATSLSYTFQLYFDFSGYTDMAIGISLMFNIKLPINFNSPYKALNIQDFWRRWHMTLSRFLRDYIYIPLGGNKISSFRTYTNLLATFVIGGLWHGAGWTFIFWGFLHGMALIIHRVWTNLGFKMWTWLAWFITFNFVNIAWVFFRAKSWDDAIKVLKGMFFGKIICTIEFANIINYMNPLTEYIKLYGLKNISFISIYTLEMLIFGFVLVMFSKNTIEKTYEKNNHKNLLFGYSIFCAILFLISIFLMSVQEYTEFLYFNF